MRESTEIGESTQNFFSVKQVQDSFTLSLVLNQEVLSQFLYFLSSPAFFFFLASKIIPRIKSVLDIGFKPCVMLKQQSLHVCIIHVSTYIYM